MPRVGGEGIVLLKVSQSTSSLALVTLRLRRVEEYSVIIKLRSCHEHANSLLRSLKFAESFVT